MEWNGMSDLTVYSNQMYTYIVFLLINQKKYENVSEPIKILLNLSALLVKQSSIKFSL